MAAAIPTRSLISGFLHSLRTEPARPSLEIGDDAWTYEQLWNYAGRIAARLRDTLAPSEDVVAILASRSIAAYGGILGILASGRGYCPLNPKFPLDRTLVMMKASGCKTLIVGRECAAVFEELLPRLDVPLKLILPDEGWALNPASASQHMVFASRELTKVADPSEPGPRADATAYLLFTSGSTGIPKGVAVSQSNAVAYMEYAKKRFGFHGNDRCSQNFDLTFDLSVHDLFTCWDAGATL